MSHADAALTPRHRLRLGRAVGEQGWTISYAAAVFNVSWPTAKKWANRYRTGGPAASRDAARLDEPQSVDRSILVLAVARSGSARRGQEAGLLVVADRVRSHADDRCQLCDPEPSDGCRRHVAGR